MLHGRVLSRRLCRRPVCRRTCKSTRRKIVRDVWIPGQQVLQRKRRRNIPARVGLHGRRVPCVWRKHGVRGRCSGRQSVWDVLWPVGGTGRLVGLAGHSGQGSLAIYIAHLVTGSVRVCTTCRDVPLHAFFFFAAALLVCAVLFVIANEGMAHRSIEAKISVCPKRELLRKVRDSVVWVLWTCRRQHV